MLVKKQYCWRYVLDFIAILFSNHAQAFDKCVMGRPYLIPYISFKEIENGGPR